LRKLKEPEADKEREIKNQKKPEIAETATAAVAAATERMRVHVEAFIAPCDLLPVPHR
jgi:hypothetical protein